MSNTWKNIWSSHPEWELTIENELKHAACTNSNSKDYSKWLARAENLVSQLQNDLKCSSLSIPTKKPQNDSKCINIQYDVSKLQGNLNISRHYDDRNDRSKLHDNSTTLQHDDDRCNVQEGLNTSQYDDDRSNVQEGLNMSQHDDDKSKQLHTSGRPKPVIHATECDRSTLSISDVSEVSSVEMETDDIISSLEIQLNTPLATNAFIQQNSLLPLTLEELDRYVENNKSADIPSYNDANNACKNGITLGNQVSSTFSSLSLRYLDDEMNDKVPNNLSQFSVALTMKMFMCFDPQSAKCCLELLHTPHSTRWKDSHVYLTPDEKHDNGIVPLHAVPNEIDVCNSTGHAAETYNYDAHMISDATLSGIRGGFIDCQNFNSCASALLQYIHTQNIAREILQTWPVNKRDIQSRRVQFLLARLASPILLITTPKQLQNWQAIFETRRDVSMYIHHGRAKKYWDCNMSLGAIPSHVKFLDPFRHSVAYSNVAFPLHLERALMAHIVLTTPKTLMGNEWTPPVSTSGENLTHPVITSREGRTHRRSCLYQIHWDQISMIWFFVEFSRQSIKLRSSVIQQINSPGTWSRTFRCSIGRYFVFVRIHLLVLMPLIGMSIYCRAVEILARSVHEAENSKCVTKENSIGLFRDSYDLVNLIEKLTLRE